MAVIKLVILVLCCWTLEGCAFFLDSPRDVVEYTGGPGRLHFYDRSGKQLPSYHEVDDDSIHRNFISLDKQEDKVVVARFGRLFQVDTLLRNWSVPLIASDLILLGGLFAYRPTTSNAVLTIGGIALDFLTSSYLKFEDVDVQLSEYDSTELPVASNIPLTWYEEWSRARFRFSAHLGFLSPVHQVPLIFTSGGVGIGVRLDGGLWTNIAFSSGGMLQQELGPERKVYATTATNWEAGLVYFPAAIVFLSGSLAYMHLTFNRGFGNLSGPHGFSRNAYGGAIGFGANFAGFMIEYRRFAGFDRVDTPLGPGHAVAFSQVRFGCELHLP